MVIFKWHSPLRSIIAIVLAVVFILSGTNLAQGMTPSGISSSESSEAIPPEDSDTAPGASSLVPGISGIMLAAAPPLPPMHYLPVTMFNYDKDAINKYIRSKNRRLDDDELLLMGSNDGIQNTWLNSEGDNDVLQGIMLPTLGGDGTPQTRFGKADYFGSSAFSGKTVYDGYSFPMQMDDDGYYLFDSRETHLHMTGGGNKLVAHSSEGPTIPFMGKTIGALDGPNNGVGFFPFNSDQSEGSAKTKPDYYFGMSMSIPFTMKYDGHIDSKQTIPMTFQFSGDDDVWVFIDDKLVLDLGGIHGASSGKIDFSTLTVTADHVYGKFVGSGNSLDLVEYDGDSVTQSFNELGFTDFGGSTASEHTLQFFYLERGAGESSCRLRFNSADPPMSITAGKVLDKSLAAHGDPIVTFRLQSLDEHNNIIISTDYRTLRFEDGSTARQEVTFDNLSAGKYLLTELATQRYKRDGITDITNGVLSGDGVIFTLTKDKNVGSAEFKNSKANSTYLSHTDLAVNKVLLVGGEEYED